MPVAPYVLKYEPLHKLRHLARSAPLDYWLSADERALYEQWHDSQRRETWLGGRLLAKRLICDTLLARSNGTVALPEIEIDSGPARGRRERPRIAVQGRTLARSLSITHTSCGVMVALATRSDVRLGVDLVEATNLSEGFVRTWFSKSEQQWLQQGDQASQASQAWAMKEALYKACNEGEGFSPRSIRVQPAISFSCHYTGNRDAGNRKTPFCQVRSWQIDHQRAALAYFKIPRKIPQPDRSPKAEVFQKRITTFQP